MAVQHIVLFRFKQGTLETKIRELFEELAALKEKIPGILYFAWGPNTSPEGLNKGFSHGFLMTFESPEARDAYLPHPEHERVKDMIFEHLEDVLVFDFEVPAGR